METKNKRHFKHLSFTDRLKIETAKNQGLSSKQIAQNLGVHVSTVNRELKRGAYERKLAYYTIYDKLYKTVTAYSPDIAQEKYRENLKAKGAELKIGNDLKLANYIEDKIVNHDYTPLAVLGEIKKLKLQFATSICVRTLYSYIEKGIFLRLSIKHLPLKSKQKKRNRSVTIAKAPRGESIEKRPADIAERTTFGNWEMDCVCGKTKHTFLTLTERLTRKEIIMPMPNQQTASVVNCLNLLEKRYGKLFYKIFKTITVDNGAEFSDCQGMETSRYGNRQRTKIYYCHPYCASERGTNERLNREIRRKVPKGTSLNRISTAKVKNIEHWMNNYPRQVLGFSTPDELFNKQIAALS